LRINKYFIPEAKASFLLPTPRAERIDFMLFKLFMQPYMDEDNGVNLGGGGEPAPESNPAPEPAPEPQGGNEPEQAPSPQSIKVKFNHQELDLPYEEAVTHIQKGMNYDKAVERARQEAAQQARDSWIAEQRYEWKGKLITTEAEYNEALRESELEQEISRKYAQLPEDVRAELLENRKFREQYQTQQKTIEEQQRKAQEEKDFADRRNTMYDEFFAEFPDYDTEEKWQTIPKEVWLESEKWLKTGGREGRRLADAMTRHNWKQGQAQAQANDVNQANANASTGSARGQAKSGPFFTREQVAAMSREEIRQNYNAIKESEGRWK